MRYFHLIVMSFYDHFALQRRALSLFLIICLIPVFGFAKTENVPILSEKEIHKIYEQSWQMLSRIHIDKTGLDKAIELYEKVLKIAPYDKDIQWKLSEATFKKAEIFGQDENSLEMYKKALNYAKDARDDFPNSIEAHFWVGCCSARVAEINNGIRALPMLNEARSELKITIKLNSEHRLAILAKAILSAIYIGTPWPLKNTKKAELFAQEAVEKDPNLTFARIMMARVFLQQKKYLRARQEAVKCLNIVKPTYIWDAELYNWPEARRLLEEIDKNE